MALIRAVAFDFGHTLVDERRDTSVALDSRAVHLMPEVSKTLPRIPVPLGVWANTRTATGNDLQQLGEHGGGWALENQGFGPAINIRHTEVGGSGRFRENVRALAANSDFFFLEGFNIEVMRNHVLMAEYESLSGRKYRTVVDWPDHVMRTVPREIR